MRDEMILLVDEEQQIEIFDDENDDHRAEERHGKPARLVEADVPEQIRKMRAAVDGSHYGLRIHDRIADGNEQGNADGLENTTDEDHDAEQKHLPLLFCVQNETDLFEQGDLRGLLPRGLLCCDRTQCGCPSIGSGKMSINYTMNDRFLHDTCNRRPVRIRWRRIFRGGLLTCLPSCLLVSGLAADLREELLKRSAQEAIKQWLAADLREELLKRSAQEAIKQ